MPKVETITFLRPVRGICTLFRRCLGMKAFIIIIALCLLSTILCLFYTYQPPRPVCDFPELDPYDKAIFDYVHHAKPLTCKPGIPNFVTLESDDLKIDYTKVHTYLKGDKDKFKGCKSKVIARNNKSDYKYQVMRSSPVFVDSFKINPVDENFMVECIDDKDKPLSRSYFSFVNVKKDLEEILKKNYELHESLHTPLETLSVLMLGIDGVSKQHFQRGMSETRDFLLKDMNAIELHKYNKVGDNTFPNVMPLLTGKFAEEFLTDSWHWQKKPFDAINDAFIWSDFRKAGYRTSMLLDSTVVTAFHYKKKGWTKPPVDYYYRPVILATEKDDVMREKNKQHCMGDTPRMKIFYDHWLQFTSVFNNTKTIPYFGYSFSMEPFHDDMNRASAMDDLYHEFLQKLVDRRVLNNTVLIFFSDHGPRFGGIRQTFNGVIEGRTPFIFFVFPPWFHKKYPHLIDTLKVNQERLTTAFDVYETLKDLLVFHGKSGQGDISSRGISLFKEIPLQRTCRHIGIPPEYCVCNLVGMSEANLSPEMSQILADILMAKIASIVTPLIDNCVPLTLQAVLHIMELKPEDEITKVKDYRVTIKTDPNDAIYEGRVLFSPEDGTGEVEGEIARLNLYRGQAECIDDPNLRPFCNCKGVSKPK